MLKTNTIYKEIKSMLNPEEPAISRYLAQEVQGKPMDYRFKIIEIYNKVKTLAEAQQMVNLLKASN